MKRIKSLKSITTRDIRKDSHTLTQHVGLKAHNGVDIFREDEDREHFMESINKACEKYEVELLVCVLMTNHVHMILKGEISSLSSFSSRLVRRSRARTTSSMATGARFGTSATTTCPSTRAASS